MNNGDFRCVSLQLLVPGLCIRRASREGCASISSISVCIIYRHVRLIKCISASTCAPIYRTSEAAWMEPPYAALLKTSSPPSFRIPHLFVSVSHLLKSAQTPSRCRVTCRIAGGMGRSAFPRLSAVCPQSHPSTLLGKQSTAGLPYPAVPLKESVLFPFLLIAVLRLSWLRDCRKQQPDCFVPSLRDCSVGAFFKQNTHLLRGKYSARNGCLQRVWCLGRRWIMG